MKIDFIDVRRAFFHAPAVRRVYVELLAEDAQTGYVGLLLMSIYGTRDAGQNRNIAYTRFMESIGCKRGASCAYAFWQKDALDLFWGKLSERFGCKHRGEWVRARTISSPEY